MNKFEKMKFTLTIKYDKKGRIVYRHHEGSINFVYRYVYKGTIRKEYINTIPNYDMYSILKWEQCNESHKNCSLYNIGYKLLSELEVNKDAVLYKRFNTHGIIDYIHFRDLKKPQRSYKQIYLVAKPNCEVWTKIENGKKEMGFKIKPKSKK